MCRDDETDYYGGPCDGQVSIYCGEHQGPGWVQPFDSTGAYVLTDMGGRLRWRYVTPPPPVLDDMNDNGYTRGGTDG